MENFERDDIEMLCPFGPGWCGKGASCPLHGDIAAFEKERSDDLVKTTLAVFAK